MTRSQLLTSTFLVTVMLAGCGQGSIATDPDDSLDVVEQPIFPPTDSVDFAHEASDLLMDEDVLYATLPNGLRYAVMRNDTPTETATLLMRVDVGSLDETDETRGIAHFLEHMAFNGSDAIPEGEMIKRLERLGLAFGPDTNASTSFDQTTYQLELPDVTDELLGEALSIFRETAERLTLSPDAIERERGIILAEKRARNSPAFRAQIASLDFQTEGSGLIDRLPIGTQETIETVTPEQFRSFYDVQYRPEDTFIVLVGDRETSDLAQMIETAFSDWDNKTPPAGDTTVPEFAFDTPRYGAFFDPEITTSISLSTISKVKPEEQRRDTVQNRADSLPLYFANRILNRRFARKVRNGEASYTGAGTGVSDLFAAAEIASLQVSAEPDKIRDGFIEAERLLRQAIDHGFSQAELDEQIANARKSWEVAVQTAPTRRTPSLARQILGNFANERVFTTAESSLERFDASIGGLTLEQVENALRDAWDAYESAPQLFLQGERDVDDPEGYLKDLLTEARSVSLPAPVDAEAGEFAYADWGAPGAIAERSTIEDIGITTVRFENGVRLNMKTTDYETDVIRLRASVGSGSAYFPEDQPAFDLHLGSVLGASALGAHTSDQLSTLLAGKTAGVSRSFGLRDMSLSGVTVPNDVEVQLQLMTAYFIDPAYREEVLERYQSQIRSVWSKLDTTPGGAAGIEVPSILSSGHWTDVHPSEEQALAVDLDALQSWYDTHVRGGHVEIGIVGDFNEDEMIAMVAQTFGALSGLASEPREVPQNAVDYRFPDGRVAPYVITHSGEPDTGAVRVYWPVPSHDTDLMDRRLRVLASVLRLELNEVLREEEGATYSPSAFTSLPLSNPDWGYVAASIEASPDEVERLTAVIESVVAKLMSEGVDADTFDRATAPTLENLETSLESNSYWLGVVDEAQTRLDSLVRHRTRDAMYAEMTAEDITEVARQVFNPEAAIRIHVVPE